jgi:HAMP domain-containing protein
MLGLSLIVVFFIAQAALVWATKDRLHEEVVEVTRRNTLATVALSELAVLAQQIRRYEKEYFVYVGNETRRAAYVKEWTQTHDKISALISTTIQNKGGAFSESDISKVAGWRAASDFYGEQMKTIFGTVDSRATQVAQNAAAATAANAKPATSTASAVTAAVPAVAMFGPTDVNDMIKDGKDRFSAGLIKGVTELQTEKSRETLSLSDVASKGFDRLIYGVLITAALGIVIALALIVLLPGTITGPVARLAAAVDAMSRGQLDTPLEAGNFSEFVTLEKSLERMRLAQQAMVSRLRLKK